MVKKRGLFAAMLLAVMCSLYAAQTLPHLAILPFTGDNPEDAATLAEFFSFQPEIQRNFTLVPRIPDHIQSMVGEYQFQRSGLGDSDTIAEMGRQMNAEYVLAGHITSLGTGADRRYLLLITVIHVEEFRQAAGDYREFRRIQEAVVFVPEMARRIAASARQDTSQLQRLAVLPFALLTSGIDEGDAEILAQILTTNIANTGDFAVFPRTRAITAMMREHNSQHTMTDPYTPRTDEPVLNYALGINARRFGEAVNVQYVLGANARRIGEDFFFSASLLNVARGDQRVGTMRRYRTVADGLSPVAALARELTFGRTDTAGNFVRVQGGTFLMGSPEGTLNSRENERPTRSVTVSSFYMGRHPVTQGDWYDLIGTRPSGFSGPNWRNLPVERVSWFDAIEFANAKSRRAGLTPAYTISGTGAHRTASWNRAADGYRLPTEAEWEFAARGGSLCPDNFMYSGGNAAGEVAWYFGNSRRRPQDVGTRRSNALGLYDMSGNVWEWVWDWFGLYPAHAQTNPEGAFSGSGRVTRGGSWGWSTGGLGSANRGNMGPAGWYGIIGFRLVRP